MGSSMKMIRLMPSVWLWSHVCITLFVTVCSSDGISLDHPLVTRNTRCGLKTLTCKISPETLCGPGEACKSVKSLFSPAKGQYCEAECTPAPTTASMANTTEELTDVINGTAFPNDTTTPSLSKTTEADGLNRSYCHKNYFCQNGGNCTETYLLGRNSHPRCVCPPEWRGDFCQNECSLDCHGNGRCLIYNGTQVCNCHIEYAPPDCKFLKTTADPDLPPDTGNELIYIIILLCISVVVLLLVGYFVLLKLRGRSLFVTKLFHYFQPYEDDDGKQFDAFISFRSTNTDYSQSDDERFVLRVLQPMLENHFQYNVCVHYRDFPPGETIANNIMWAVENSRRTILILSPLYVESEWARLEYQKAQQEMLQLRHKIIPIIFRDISDTHIEDPTLKHILSSVTYINYPSASDEREHSKFWKMLHLSLPKKRSVGTDMALTNASENCPSTIITTTPGIVSQQSWQSSRTDVTELRSDSPVQQSNKDDTSKDIFSNSNDFADINELEKNRANENKNIKNGKETENNTDIYIAKLEGVP